MAKLALAGIGGFGEFYVREMLKAHAEGKHQFVGAADPLAERSARLADLKAAGVAVYATLEELLARTSPDLTAVSSPIQFHCEQVCAALGKGSHVVCEKPLGATPEEARRMIAARDAAGRVVSIGYQWSFSPAVLELKRMIQAGELGRPRRLRTLVLWPRDEAYYHRNSWAGRVKDGQGRWVLDSPLNNACAHFLHHMLFLLGEGVASARMEEVRAEVYRANPIENFDTAVVRGKAAGAEVLMVTSHATEKLVGPVFEFEFEKGTLHFDQRRWAGVRAIWADGQERDCGVPADWSDMTKLWATLEAGERGRPSACGLEAAMAQTEVVWAVHEHGVIETIAAGRIRQVQENGGRRLYVEGLGEYLQGRYEGWGEGGGF